MKNVLAFFGAFNPPTLAHVETARYAFMKTGREGVVFVPSKSVYIREDQGKDFAFPEQKRVLMLEEICRDNPWMEVCDYELNQKSQPRTFETLRYLKSRGYQPSLLFGSDKLCELEYGWKHVEEIVSEFGIVCMTRGDDDTRKMIREDAYLQKISHGIELVETPGEFRNYSSTKVRRLLLEMEETKQKIRTLVPEQIRKILDVDEEDKENELL